MRIVEQHRDLRPAVGHILEVHVRPGHPMHVRRSAILAGAADVEVGAVDDLLGVTDDADDPAGDDEAVADPDAPAAESSAPPQGRRASLAGLVSGAGRLRLDPAIGEGTLWLGRGGGDVTVVSVDGPAVLLAQHELLATEASVRAELTTKLPTVLKQTIGARRAWTLTGSGQVAFATNGEPVAIDVRPDAALRIESSALLAYDAAIEFVRPDDYRKRMGKRSARKAVGVAEKVPGVNIPSIDTGRERVWIIATGTGTVLIRNAA